MLNHSKLIALAVLAGFSILPQGKAESHDDVVENSKFLRIRSVDGEPAALQTAITRYRSDSANGVSVDLIGAVHVGEASYYEQLNAAMKKYDVVLYELVAPSGAAAPQPGQKRSGNPLAMLQAVMPSVLGLESQLEKIDYSGENFVRADMTTEQISEKMKHRGDTPLTIALTAFAEMMRQQNLAAEKGDEVNSNEKMLDLFGAFGNPVAMKRVMAQQFTAEQPVDMMMGTTLNRMLIDDRNAEAVRVLQRQLAAGKRKIAIFYGAAHMPDFDRRLRVEFGLRRKKQKWIDAWDLTRVVDANEVAQDPVVLLWQLFETIQE